MAEEQTEEKAWKSSFTEDGVTYAASLFWQPLLNEDAPMPEIKDASENILEGADLYVVRKGKSSQFGLAASTQGFSRGLPSAAIALISSLGNVTSFLGVFKVDTGWWYICFRNDVILSDGDTLFVNESDAKDQFVSMLAVPDWDVLFAPEEWQIDDTKPADLSLLKKGLHVKLEKIVTSSDTMMLAVIIACFAVIAWFGYSTVRDMFFQKPPEPVITPIQQEAPKPLPPEPKPWENVDNPVDVLRNCYLATQKVVELVSPGWILEGVTCDAKTGLVTSWRRQLGRLSVMEQALDVSGVNFSSRVISEDGETVMVTLPIGNVSTLNSPPEYTPFDLNNTINDLNQALSIKISLEQKSWVSPRGTTYNLAVFKLSAPTGPLEWVDLLTRFSGLSVKTVTYDKNAGIWNYEGEIYEL
ncbi:MAG: type 4b pilus protein PilO2 [Alphaproteobacteria bacterium]|nr:type 4b pilus protein PilO2 [Alphaproteobacteria bacterium]